MSAALSIFVPAEQQGTKPKPKASAADLLSAATKKPGKGSSHLRYTGDPGRELAVRWLTLDAQLTETERELGLLKDQILGVIRPWHLAACQGRRSHESTVEVPTDKGMLRVSFQHRYSKLPIESEADLRHAVGDDYDRFFKRIVGLKLKKEIADDPDTLEQLVERLGEAIGAEAFEAVFEVEQSLIPTKAYTETNFQIPPEARAALAAAGVKQIVGMAAAK